MQQLQSGERGVQLEQQQVITKVGRPGSAARPPTDWGPAALAAAAVHCRLPPSPLLANGHPRSPSHTRRACPTRLLQQQAAPGMATDKEKRSLTWAQITKSLCAGGVAGAV